MCKCQKIPFHPISMIFHSALPLLHACECMLCKHAGTLSIIMP